MDKVLSQSYSFKSQLKCLIFHFWHSSPLSIRWQHLSHSYLSFWFSVSREYKENGNSQYILVPRSFLHSFKECIFQGGMCGIDLHTQALVHIDKYSLWYLINFWILSQFAEKLWCQSRNHKKQPSRVDRIPYIWGRHNPGNGYISSSLF